MPLCAARQFYVHGFIYLTLSILYDFFSFFSLLVRSSAGPAYTTRTARYANVCKEYDVRTNFSRIRFCLIRVMCTHIFIRFDVNVKRQLGCCTLGCLNADASWSITSSCKSGSDEHVYEIRFQLATPIVDAYHSCWLHLETFPIPTFGGKMSFFEHLVTDLMKA